VPSRLVNVGVEQDFNSNRKTWLQVHILGMTDMLRQAENLSWDQFSAIYEATLLEHNLLPSMPIEDFANGIGERASNNEDVAKVMRVGAESLQRALSD
jgi:hypothetical protein